jgi:hypothetical protein
LSKIRDERAGECVFCLALHCSPHNVRTRSVVGSFEEEVSSDSTEEKTEKQPTNHSAGKLAGSHALVSDVDSALSADPTSIALAHTHRMANSVSIAGSCDRGALAL